MPTYSKFLCHFNGDDDSQVFVDEVGYAITVVGNTHIHVGEKMFGSASGYFDGSGDYLKVALSEALHVGTGAFTFDWWMYQTDAGRSSCQLSYGGSNAGFAVYQKTDGKFLLYAGGARITSAAAYSTGEWHHVALVGNGGAAGSRTMTLYVDGAPVGTWTVDYNYSKQIYIGANEAATGENHKGYLDEFRFSKGIERWTADFSASLPAAEYETPTPSPSARLTQMVSEVITLPTTAKARLTQEVVEVAVFSTSSKARLTQEVVEVAVFSTSSKARVTQVAVEVAVLPSSYNITSAQFI